ncbi:MAG: helix-turn-helix domain-containing protein [Cryobacterium sp.]
MDTVKSRRRYDSRGRQAQARRNGNAILDVAEEKFLQAGYFSTTVAEIATESGVSVETIYKIFGGKSGLVRAIYERGLGGRGATAAYERSDEMRLYETDPESLMRKWGALTAEVASEVTPILLLVRTAAATDEGMAALLLESNKQRLERMEHNARFMQSRGFLRDDVSLEEAIDVMWLNSSPELYELLVLQRGWSLERFARFVGDSLAGALVRRTVGPDTGASAADAF